ncbi:HlyD family secretion protein [Mesoterricola silvestris]|uniref:Multidrug export protein EmrA n=1 Tax=Mesoterricola silvestris TaxID=2927979 RepID=A0AA48K9T9_9BACT|nr:HlyD family secretion protein [Mesoterricola silvestris]BDU74329.1 multidrug export protein EmrA [Mesoterricola silvestris]
MPASTPQTSGAAALEAVDSIDIPLPEAPAAAPVSKRRRLASMLAAGALAAGSLGGAYYLRQVAPFESTDDAFIDGHIIGISPQVSAQAAVVHVDDNQMVHKGDLLVELDPTDFQVALSQARGAEAASRGKLAQAQAGVAAAESAVLEAQATLHSVQATFENAETELRRLQGVDARARSQRDLDTAVAARKTSFAAQERAQAQVRSAQAQVIQARANVTAAEGDYQKAQADTRKAQVNLDHCRILAPEDGRVTGKAVDAGAYVTPSNPLFQIVPAKVWVVANFKETQLKHMAPGQPVEVSVDAFPNLTLTGRVDSIQSGTGSRFSVIPTENATGNFVKVVQRVPVKILLDNDKLGQLAPGMSVEPKVRVHS